MALAKVGNPAGLQILRTLLAGKEDSDNELGIVRLLFFAHAGLDLQLGFAEWKNAALAWLDGQHH
jgi:hypothetical protein